jgi:hypothetical protein
MGIEKSLVPFAPSICLFFSFAIQPRTVFKKGGRYPFFAVHSIEKGSVPFIFGTHH